MWLVALGGMGMGHWLTYVLAHPDASDRFQVLEATGHGIWGSLALAAAMGAFAAGATFAILRLVRRAGSGRNRLYAHALPLIGLQCGSFIAVETIERALAPGHTESLWGGGLLLVGLLVQALAACAALLAGALLSSLIWPARRGLSAFVPPASRPQHSIRCTTLHFGPTAALRSPRLRGPPEAAG